MLRFSLGLCVTSGGVQDYVGPTEESNWVLPGRLLVGAYPAALDDEVNDSIVASILRLGCSTFVCLQAEYEHNGVTEQEWRSGQKLRYATPPLRTHHPAVHVEGTHTTCAQALYLRRGAVAGCARRVPGGRGASRGTQFRALPHRGLRHRERRQGAAAVQRPCEAPREGREHVHPLLVRRGAVARCAAGTRCAHHLPPVLCSGAATDAPAP